MNFDKVSSDDSMFCSIFDERHPQTQNEISSAQRGDREMVIQSPPPPPPKTTAKIMIVDDNSYNIFSLQTIMKYQFGLESLFVSFYQQ